MLWSHGKKGRSWLRDLKEEHYIPWCLFLSPGLHNTFASLCFCFIMPLLSTIHWPQFQNNYWAHSKTFFLPLTTYLIFALLSDYWIQCFEKINISILEKRRHLEARSQCIVLWDNNKVWYWMYLMCNVAIKMFTAQHFVIAWLII